MKVGIIGGSGLDDPKILSDYSEAEVETPYGKPSSKVTGGKISGVEVCILARHGRGHSITPTNVNNRANIWALKSLGCTHIIATTAVGSLREEIKPCDIVIPDQLIDFTRHRKSTFHDDFEKGVAHASLAEPFSENLRKMLIHAAEHTGVPFHSSATLVTIEGPRFSTKAESRMFRTMGADIINMSVAPEAALAREAGLEYAAVAMSTDYDCWRESGEAVSWDMIERRMKENSEKVKRLIIRAIEDSSRKG
jgi:5'-methylthioadenosine phosphorylase